MHPITIKVDKSTYKAAEETAASRGYSSVENYVSDWLASLDIPMTPEIAAALEEGIADIEAGQ